MLRADRTALFVFGLLLVVAGVVGIAVGVAQADGWTVVWGGVAMLLGGGVAWYSRKESP